MPDALILGALSETTILVVRADVSDRRATEAAFAALVNIGVRSLGTVVNAVRRSNGYSRYVGGYYADEQPETTPIVAVPIEVAGGHLSPAGNGAPSPSNGDGQDGCATVRHLVVG